MNLVRLAVMLLGLTASIQAIAQAPGESAFVEHRLTLQLSDAGEDKQAQVLNVANNVLKVYGPDKVAIDVVAFGPGVDLLHQGNKNAERISSLVAQGVRFDVCMNTVNTIERNTGKPYPLNPQAHPVEAGIARIMTLAEHGYITVRP